MYDSKTTKSLIETVDAISNDIQKSATAQLANESEGSANLQTGHFMTPRKHNQSKKTTLKG